MTNPNPDLMKKSLTELYLELEDVKKRLRFLEENVIRHQAQPVTPFYVHPLDRQDPLRPPQITC